jgi:hypothetical protein
MFRNRSTIKVIAALALTAWALTACSSEPETSDALELLTEPDQIDGFVDFSNGTDKSFGHFACVNVEEVTLETVEPIAIEGDIEFLGSMIYDASEAFVAAVDGYPPDGLDPSYTRDFEGAVISVSCEEDSPEVKTQILLGANRTGPGGGKIDGIRIDHSEGYLEILDYQIVLCGDDYEYCESLRPGE